MRFLTSIITCTVSAAALGADLPKRAAGLWEEKVSSSAGPGTASHRICVDDRLTDFLKGAGVCSKQEVRPQPDGYVIEAICKHGDSTSRTLTTVTGNLKQAYTAEMRSTHEPAFMGVKESRMTVNARLLGPCPAGMRGGDVTSSDGTKYNFYELEKGVMPK